ncbi:MAG: BamA/TamA family outer membrane protein, partial [Rhodothermaceae bacterium]|nr:BamA/TamA family outer membrane protein [Rhodothermaceae bacterium]
MIQQAFSVKTFSHKKILCKALISSFLFVFLSPVTVACQLLSDANTDSTGAETYKNHNTILPALGATPETGILFGGVIMRQFKPDGAGEETRSSFLLASAIYTTKKQLMLAFAPVLIMKEEQWIMEGSYQFQLFPDSYWGIGRDSRESDEVIYQYRQWEVIQSVQKRIAENMFAGPIMRWSHISDMEFMDLDDNKISSPAVDGAEGSISAGVGIIYLWDVRNSMLTPTRGHLVRLMAMSYPGFLGTSHSYFIGSIDTRKYFDLSDNGKSVAAFNMLNVLTSGSPAFTDYPSLGGSSILRGYYYGRYRDNNTLQIQAEFRQHMFWRFG